MKEERLERRIVQMLTCDPNRKMLEQFVKNELNIDFRYLASEFPIITSQGYGFLDLVGIDAKNDSVVLIECKNKPSLLPSALKEVEYYKKSIKSHSLIQSKGLAGLYHTAIFKKNQIQDYVGCKSPHSRSRQFTEQFRIVFYRPLFQI